LPHKNIIIAERNRLIENSYLQKLNRLQTETNRTLNHRLKLSNQILKNPLREITPVNGRQLKKSLIACITCLIIKIKKKTNKHNPLTKKLKILTSPPKNQLLTKFKPHLKEKPIIKIIWKKNLLTKRSHHNNHPITKLPSIDFIIRNNKKTKIRTNTYLTQKFLCGI
jgi:hypothetical protein